MHVHQVDVVYLVNRLYFQQMKVVCIKDFFFSFQSISYFLVPSKPTEVFFPDVDHWSARMVWQQPTKLNGILIGYKLVYWRSDDEQTRIELNNLTNTTNSYLVESMLIKL